MFDEDQKLTTALSKPLSRRLFLSTTAVMGALTFLGEVTFGDTRLMAFADETGVVHFEIYMLSKDEVPVVVMDVSNPRQPKPVEGAQVVLQVKDKEPYTLALTDRCGFAPANIKTMVGVDEEGRALAEACWASVTATRNGYRAFEDCDRYFVAGVKVNDDNSLSNTVTVPVEPDDGSPYASHLSFDGLDIEYTEQDAAIVSLNDVEHPVRIILRNAGNKSWDFSLLADGKPVASASNVASSGGVAICELKGLWLDGNHGFKAGSKLAVGFAEHGKSNGRQINSKLNFTQGLELTGGYQQDTNLCTGVGFASDTELSNPTRGGDAWSPLPSFVTGKDDSMVLGAPALPVTVSFWPTGEVVITATFQFGKLGLNGIGRKFEPSKGNFWKYITPKDQWKGYKDKYLTSAEQSLDSLLSGNLGTGKVTSYVTVSMDLSIMGIGKLTTIANSKDHKGTIDFAVQAQCAAKAEFTLPFSAGPIPLYVSADFAATIWVRLMCGMDFILPAGSRTPTNITWSGMSGDLAKVKAPKVVVNFRLEAGLSVALGVKYLLSVGVRGYAYLQTQFSFVRTEEQKDKPLPHTTCIAGAAVDVFIQVMFFTKNFNVLGPWKKTLADNWDSNSNMSMLSNQSVTNLLQAQSAQQMGGFSFDELEPVPEDILVPEFFAAFNELGQLGSADPTANSASSWEEGALELANTILLSADEEADDGDGRIRVFDPYGYGDLDDGLVTSNEGTYNPINGVKPEQVSLVRKDTFSDARVRLVSTVSRSGPYYNYLFKISVVSITMPSANGELSFGVASSPDSVEGYYTQIVEGASNDSGGDGTVVRSRVTYGDCDTSRAKERMVTLPNIDPLERANMWDVDFDAIGFGHCMVAAVVSVKRDGQESAPTFNQVFNSQVVNLSYKEFVSGVSESKTPEYAVSIKDQADEADKTYAYWSPKVRAGYFKKAKDACPNLEMAFTVYCYSAETHQDGSRGGTSLFRSTLAKEKGALDLRGIEALSGKLELPAVFSKEGLDLSEGGLEVETIPAHADIQRENLTNYTMGERHFLAWSAPKTSSHEAVTVFWCNENPKDAYVAWGASSFIKLPPAKGNYNTKALKYAYVKDGTQADLKQFFCVELALDDMSLKVSEPLGTTNFTNIFLLEWGSTHSLFAVRAIEAQAPELTDTELKAIRSGDASFYGAYGQFASPLSNLNGDSIGTGGTDYIPETATMYQVVKLDWDFNTNEFKDPFPFFQLDFPIDEIIAGQTKSEFFITTIEDKEQCLASIYSVSVPDVNGLQLESVEPASTFAARGQKVSYWATVTNTGNQPVCGFTLEIYASDHRASSITIGAGTQSFNQNQSLAKALKVSPEAYVQVLDADGNPVRDEQGNPKYELDKKALGDTSTLYPGQTRTYILNELDGDFVEPVPFPPVGKGNIEFTAQLTMADYGYGSKAANTLSANSSDEDEYADLLGDSEDLADELPVNMLDPRDRYIALELLEPQVEVGLGDVSPVESSEWEPSFSPEEAAKIAEQDAAALAKVEGKAVRASAKKATKDRMPSITSESGHKVTYSKKFGNSKLSISKAGVIQVAQGLVSGEVYLLKAWAVCGSQHKLVTITVEVGE